MDTISLTDVEVRFRVGVPDVERAQPQRLLISVELELDLAPAAVTDDLAATVDYAALHQAIVALGGDREWKLIETLASDVAQLAIEQPRVQKVRVEVKKFVLPDTRHVSVRVERKRR